MLPRPKHVANIGLRCVAATSKMVLETYFPEGPVLTFRMIDQITRKELNKAVWRETFTKAELDAGCRIHTVSTWNMSEFIARRWDYLRERLGAEATEWQIRNAPDMDYVIDCMRALKGDNRLSYDYRAATTDDIRHHLSQGAYVALGINPATLYDLSGDLGSLHRILIYGFIDDQIFIQDPDVGAQVVSVERFMTAWMFGQPEARALEAYYKGV